MTVRIKKHYKVLFIKPNELNSAYIYVWFLQIHVSVFIQIREFRWRFTNVHLQPHLLYRISQMSMFWSNREIKLLRYKALLQHMDLCVNRQTELIIVRDHYINDMWSFTLCNSTRSTRGCITTVTKRDLIMKKQFTMKMKMFRLKLL